TGGGAVGPERDVVGGTALFVGRHHLAPPDGGVGRGEIVVAAGPLPAHVVGCTPTARGVGRGGWCSPRPPRGRGRALVRGLLSTTTTGCQEEGQPRHHGCHTHCSSCLRNWGVFQSCEPFHKTPIILGRRPNGRGHPCRRGAVRLDPWQPPPSRVAGV